MMGMVFLPISALQRFTEQGGGTLPISILNIDKNTKRPGMILFPFVHI